MVALLDGLCITTDGDARVIGVIQGVAVAAGGKPLPSEMLSLEAAGAQYGGKGFIVPRGNKKYAVVTTDAGACSVLRSMFRQAP